MTKFKEVQVEKIIWNNDTEFSGSYNELRNKPESVGGLQYEKVEVIIVDKSTYASYSGTPKGCESAVVITANVAGSAGNIIIHCDGVKTITQLISKENDVTLTSGDGSQIPAIKSTIVLTGGNDVLPSQFEVEHTLDTVFVRVTISGPDFMCNKGQYGQCLIASSIDTGKLYIDTVKNGPFISNLNTAGFIINIGKLEGITTFVAGTYTILIEKIN